MPRPGGPDQYFCSGCGLMNMIMTMATTLTMMMMTIVILFILHFTLEAGDPFGDDIDDHFSGNGGNLLNLIDYGDEGDDDAASTAEAPTPPSSESSSTGSSSNLTADRATVIDNGRGTTSKNKTKSKKSLNKLIADLNLAEGKVGVKAATLKSNGDNKIDDASEPEMVVEEDVSNNTDDTLDSVGTNVTSGQNLKSNGVESASKIG